MLSTVRAVINGVSTCRVICIVRAMSVVEVRRVRGVTRTVLITATHSKIVSKQQRLMYL